MSLPIVPTLKIEGSLASVWTDITRDIDLETGLHLKYGIDANGPLDCVADPGECSFSAQNWAKPTFGRPQGYYSPLHASVRSGWTWGVSIRVSLRDPTTGIWYVKHRGKARVIDPVAGTYRDRLVPIVSHDVMLELDETDARELAIQTDKTESELITAVLDSLPSESQPVSRDIDAGIDSFGYAFWDLGDGVKATGLINDIAVDSYAFIFVKGDGTFTVRNRHTRVDAASSGTFTDSTMHGFAAPNSLDQAFNQVRVTIHPPTIDAAATTVLYADQAVRSIAAGATVEFWVTYSDQDDVARTRIGALDVVTPVLATDYAGNHLETGLGADVGAFLAVTMTPFGSTALVSITNSYFLTVYLVDGSGNPFFQIRGRGVYDLGPQTYEASSTQAYGTRPLAVALRYQDDPLVAQAYAEYIEAQRHSLTNQPQTVEFLANVSTALMTQALAREPGDVITVTETMTGFASVEAVIQSVELQYSKGGILTCRWGLAPVAPFEMWELDVDAFDSDTVLGF